MPITQRSLFDTAHTPEELRTLIHDSMVAHLAKVGLNGNSGRVAGGHDEKSVIRANHAAQREEYRDRERAFVQRYGARLLSHFASGEEVVPDKVDPILCPVSSNSEDGRLFRLATLLWSVPVSRGYGRRMRFLVRDRANGKLIGIFALADPVFNLRARDEWIGWTVHDRRQRLVNVMDAHVVGAVPPYNLLLGGKLVASLMTSREVREAFSSKYVSTRGIISHQYKHPRLALITVTSALGRSSLYNRLRLSDTVRFIRVGMTEGWGHFQIPDDLFFNMRRLLEMEGHPYASGHQYGKGPNWRMRVVREALRRVDLDPDLLRHGIAREVFAAPLISNWREFLCGAQEAENVGRPSVSEIGRCAVSRWIVPRATRMPEYSTWTRLQTWELLTAGAATPSEVLETAGLGA